MKNIIKHNEQVFNNMMLIDVDGHVTSNHGDQIGLFFHEDIHEFVIGGEVAEGEENNENVFLIFSLVGINVL